MPMLGTPKSASGEADFHWPSFQIAHHVPSFPEEHHIVNFPLKLFVQK